MSIVRLSSVVLATWCAGMAHANCWVEAGQRYNIDPWLLYSIADHESRLNPGAINRNRDGSLDIGVMQINTQHLPRLATWGISREMLLDACTNIHVGAWLLADNFYRYGVNWDTVGIYNAGAADNQVQAGKRAKYAGKVASIYQAYLRGERKR